MKLRKWFQCWHLIKVSINKGARGVGQPEVRAQFRNELGIGAGCGSGGSTPAHCGTETAEQAG